MHAANSVNKSFGIAPRKSGYSLTRGFVLAMAMALLIAASVVVKAQSADDAQQQPTQAATAPSTDATNAPDAKPAPDAKLDPKTDPFTQAAPVPEEIAAIVDKHYNHIHDLQLQFVERYRGMGMERIEQGSLLLKKPGFMRWTYTRPKGKLFIIDKHDAYAYTPGDAQAQRFPVERLDDLRSPLRFLLGHTELAKEMSKLTVTTDGNLSILKGIPVGLEKRVSSLELTVTPDGTILGMKMEEVGGAETTFHFFSENDKVTVPKDAFIFTPPTGVKIVDGLPPM